MPRKKELYNLFPKIKDAKCHCWHCKQIEQDPTYFTEKQTPNLFDKSIVYGDDKFDHFGLISIKDLSNAVEGSLDTFKDHVFDRAKQGAKDLYKQKAIELIHDLKKTSTETIVKAWLSDSPHEYNEFFDFEKENFKQAIAILTSFFNLNDKQLNAKSKFKNKQFKNYRKHKQDL